MKKILFIIPILLSCACTFAQTGWITKRIDNNISVKFPHEPISDTKPEKRLTLYAYNYSTDCGLMVMVRTNAMPDYDIIINQTEKEQETAINNYLDKGISSFILNSKILSPSTDIRIGNFIGKQITYLENNNGKSLTNYAKFIFANNSLYVVNCSMGLSANCQDAKNYFLSSITVN